MKQILIFIYLLSVNLFSAQLNKEILGKWTMSPNVTTEFMDTDFAVKQMEDNKVKYQYLEKSLWDFKKDGVFEVKLKNGKTEKGTYTADENRFIIIFEKEEIEEFNTTNVVVADKKVTLSMGRGMTKLIFEFARK